MILEQSEFSFYIPQEVQERCLQTPLLEDLFPMMVGRHVYVPKHYIHRPDGSGDHLVIHCLSGMGWCEIEGQTIQVTPGFLLVLPAGIPHRYGAFPEDPWQITWVHFGGRRAGYYMDAIRSGVSQPLVRIAAPQSLYEAFLEILHGLEKGFTETGLLAVSTALARYLSLIALHRRETGEKASQTEIRILESIQYLRDHLPQPHTLEDLARKATLSVPHYVALFRKQTGSSPLRFLLWLRIQRACYLLDNTTATIQEIADQVGFEDPFYFSRQFKKVVGHSPRCYRNLIKG